MEFISLTNNDIVRRSVVIALHGFTGDPLDFAQLATATTEEHNWYAANIHRQGSINEIIAALDRFIDHVRGSNVILLGYSMGGRIALQYALARAQRLSHLILISATAGIENDQERVVRRRSDTQLANFALECGTVAFIDRWHQQPLIATQKRQIKQQVYESMLLRRYSLSASDIAGDLRNLGLGEMANCWPQIHVLDCPTLLITGENDQKFCSLASRMAHLMPNGEHLKISNSGHAPHLENPNEFLSCLKQLRI